MPWPAPEDAAMIIMAIGLVLVIEGLVLALAPSRVEDVLELLQRLSLDSRRYIGLGFLAAGVVVIGLATAWAG